MWINSPLGKWEQDARVNQALRDAEQRRAHQATEDAGLDAPSATLIRSVRAGLRWHVDLARRALGLIWLWPADPSAPHAS